MSVARGIARFVYKINNETLLVWSFIIFFSIPVVIFCLGTEDNQHFTYLADSFLKGNLYIAGEHLEEPIIDYSFFGGNYYWPEAPFAAVVLVPFVWLFGISFLQGYLQLVVFYALIYVVYKLARLYNFSNINSLYFAIAFCFGTVTYGLLVAPWSYYFSQLLSVLFLLFAVYIYKREKSLWLIGILLGAAIATRYSVLFGALFFIGRLWLDTDNKRVLLKKYFQLLAPVGIFGLCILLYNYLRFESPWLTGYGFFSLGANDWYGINKYGLFNISNIPGNLYYYFLTMPQPVHSDNTYHIDFPYITGNLANMSFFLVSPVFLYVIRTFKKITKEIVLLWGVAGIQLLFLLTLVSPGTLQYLGPRYMLDLMPWLLLLLFISFQETELSKKQKILILCSGVLNLYLIITALYFQIGVI